MACITMRIAATFFSTLIFLHCFPSTVHSASFNKIQLPPYVTGPEALAFELITGRFYTGVADGRIFKYNGPTAGFADFGFTAPNRSKSLCDGINSANPNPACGRPLGMALHHATKKLYVCDAFFGFGVLDPEGGLVTNLSTSADGEPYRLCDDVAVHQPTGNVYFTDISSVYDIRQIAVAISSRDSTGRVLKYDVKTKEVTVLYRNLSGPGGVAVDEGEKFVMVSEYIANRTIKIWLKGPKAKKFDVVNRRPMPDNIRGTKLGNFWLATTMVNQRTQSIEPIGLKINEFGTVLKTVNFERWYGSNPISEVHEFGGKLYVGSLTAGFIGSYKD